MSLGTLCFAHTTFLDGNGSCLASQLTLTIVRQTGGLGISIAGGKGSTPYKGDDEVTAAGRRGGGVAGGGRVLRCGEQTKPCCLL